MATITRASAGTGVLQTLLYKRTLQNLEPNLYFYKLGARASYEDGYNTVSWARFSALAEDGTSTLLAEGQTPSEKSFSAETVSVVPTQYGMYVTLSDMLLDVQPINYIAGAAKEIGSNLARVVDKAIQDEVFGGTNVIYGGARTARTEVTDGDILTADLLNLARTKLEIANAPTFEGYYVAVMHPTQAYALRKETGTGSWLETSKYADPEKLLTGEIGAINGIRVVVSTNVKTFASTKTVHPVLVCGSEAYGVADLRNIEIYVTPRQSTDSDPLAQRTKVGAKVAFGVKRLSENAMVRIEVGSQI